VAQRHVNSALNEKEMLSALRHPFITNMHHAFQSHSHLYLTMDFKHGGDLRYQLLKHKFVEEEAKFIISCVVIGLEYVHSKQIIHRDLKPENLLFDEKGYVYLSDFGEAKTWSQENSNDVSGTPGYMAPEVLCQQNHSYPADWFAVGVILHEIITGSRPFPGKNLKEVKEKILESQVQLNVDTLSTSWSKTCEDFVNQLIQTNPENRLGFRGIEEIKNHSWLKDVEWDKVLKKKVNPRFAPKRGSNFNRAYVNEDWSDGIKPKCDFKQEMFAGYFYVEMPDFQNVDNNKNTLIRKKSSFGQPHAQNGGSSNQKPRGKSSVRS